MMRRLATAVAIATLLTSMAVAQQRAPSLRSALIEENARWLTVHRSATGESVINVPALQTHPQRFARFHQGDTDASGDITAMGVTVRWRYDRQRQAADADPGPLTIEVAQDGKVVLTRRYEALEAIGGAVQIARLDPTAPHPQVIVLTSGGGSINYSPMLIATADRPGEPWRWIEAECCNGDPELRLVTAEDPVDRTGIIVDIDIVQLGSMSNADRWSTAAYRLLKLVNGRLIDVSREERFRDHHQRRLAEWFRHADGFLRGRPSIGDPQWLAQALGYVRIKTLLGEFPQAWRTFSDRFGFRRNARDYREVRETLVGWNGITSAAMASPAPATIQVSVRVRDVLMNGGIKEVDVTLWEGGQRRLIRDVIVNCGRTGIPQVIIGDRRWTINEQAMTVQDGPAAFPAVQVWRSACRS